MKLLPGILCGLLLSFAAVAADASRTFYVQFIWATDQPRPNGKQYREVGPKLTRKLSPLRWKHYWEVEQKQISVRSQHTTRVNLPRQRKVEIELLKTGDVDVRLYRRTGLVTKTRQTINGKMAILGGEEDNKDSFFLVVRSDEPKHGE